MNKLNDGVVYFCGGLKPVLELYVSIYSLRKHYSGNITVLLGETSIKYAEQLLNLKDINVVIVKGSSNDINTRQHWSTRWKSMNLINYDRVIHLDCDTIIVKPIDDLFNHIHKDKSYITSFDHFNDGKEYRSWKHHLNMYKASDSYFNKNQISPLYIEFGLMGWNKDYHLFNEISKACNIMKDDQTAMSSVLIKNGRKGYCPDLKFKPIKRTNGYYGLHYDAHYETIVWHLTTSHGKCPGFAIWWREFIDAYMKNYMNFKSNKNIIQTLQPHVYKQLMNKSYPISISKEGNIYLVKDVDIK
jgi:lipopolysaccharide biosynthesis glycosyltransferase